MMEVMMAPLQRFTTALFRRAHADVYGPMDEYFTPFVRMERGEPCRRTMRDVTSALNAGLKVTPQIIFADVHEFCVLTDAVTAAGAGRVDLNMGCPFPLQTRRGRGAAMPARREVLEAVAEAMAARPGVAFSIKMRPGLVSAGEWEGTIDIINAMPLRHVALHPRTGAQQYGGEADRGVFERFAQACRHPLVYNGDVATPEDIERWCGRAAAVMVGRGLLRRPSLAAEWRSGRLWSRDERLEALGRLHRALYAGAERTLSGDAQILSHLRPLWDYFEAEVGHKAAKAIRKATRTDRYLAAVDAALG